MKITWSMTKEQWQNFLSDHKSRETNTPLSKTGEIGDIYGSVAVGKLSIELLHTLDPDDWYAFTNVYCLDRDTGYGCTEDNRPYDYLDDIDIKIPFECKTFEDFKEEFLKNVLAEIEAAGLTAEAEAEDGWDTVAA